MVGRPSKTAAAMLPVLTEKLQALAYVAAQQPAAAAREMALAVQHDHRRQQDPYGEAWPATGRGLHGRAIGILRRAVRGYERTNLGTRATAGADLSPWISRTRRGRRHAGPLFGEGLVRGDRAHGPITLTPKGLAAARSKMGVAEVHKFDPQGHVRDSWYPVVRGTDAILASDHEAAAALQPRDPAKRHYRRLMHPVEGQGLGTWQKRIERMHRRLLRGAMMGAAKREELKLAAAARRQARFERQNAARALHGLPPLKPRAPRKDRARVDRLVVRAIG